MPEILWKLKRSYLPSAAIMSISSDTTFFVPSSNLGNSAGLKMNLDFKIKIKVLKLKNNLDVVKHIHHESNDFN